MYGVSLASWLGLTMSACQTAGTIPSSTIRETSHMPNAADGEVGGDRDDQGYHQGCEQEPVRVLPRGQPEHVEREVVVDDGVADPERNAVQGPREDHPRPGCRAAGDERADESHEQPDPLY